MTGERGYQPDLTSAKSYLATTALAEHDPSCRYGQSLGREACTCDVLLSYVAAEERAAEAVEAPRKGQTEKQRAALAHGRRVAAERRAARSAS